MATATVISPSPTGPYHHHSHHSSYSPSFPNPSTTSSIAGMIAPSVGSRRTPDDHCEPPTTVPGIPPPPPPIPSAVSTTTAATTTTAASRQSLPSLSDVFSKTPSFSAAPPPTTSIPGPAPPPLPSPFGAASRPPFPEKAPSSKDSSPKTLYHPSASPFPPRQPGPSPLSTFAKPHYSPPARPDPSGPTEPDMRRSEPQQISNGYPGHAPPQPMPYPPVPGPLPPGQLPLAPQYAISPQTTSITPHPYETRGPYDYGRTTFESPPVVGGHESFYILDNLNRAGVASRTVHSFIKHWLPIIQDNYGNQTALSSHLPRIQEISDMIANTQLLMDSLEHVRDHVQQHQAEEERRGRGLVDEQQHQHYQQQQHQQQQQQQQQQQHYHHLVDGGGGGSGGGGWGGQKGKSLEDVDMMKPTTTAYRSIPLPPPDQIKKRRGRAAPPGRCHSCNRSDTPEWRRGPDGARTLCNACGLHFAKLNKRKQADARALRPKPESNGQ